MSHKNSLAGLSSATDAHILQHTTVEDLDPDHQRLCERLESQLSFNVSDSSDPETFGVDYHEYGFGLDQNDLQDDCMFFTFQQQQQQHTEYGLQDGVQEQAGAACEDGWISDPEELASQFPVSSAAKRETKKKLYMFYDDDTWVDETKAVFSANMKLNSKQITEFFVEMFEAHENTYTLLLAFLRRTGKTRHQKQSVTRRVLEEFQQWLKDKSAEQKPSNAILTADHQKEALEILTRCHAVLLDDMYTIFDLSSAKTEDQVRLIRELLRTNRLKEAVTYTWKFRLQKHFKMDSMLLPLIAMDKINLIENYIDESRELQEEFIVLLDKMCEPGSTQKQIQSFLDSCHIYLNTQAINCKLNAKQLNKLALRLIDKYNLPLDKFPHLYRKKTSASLHHLIHKRYVEGTITEANFKELIQATLSGGSTHLRCQLIQELVRYDDCRAAAKWARHYNIPTEYLPFAVHVYITDSDEIGESSRDDVVKQEARQQDYFYQLSIPLTSVVFVKDRRGLQKCREAVSRPNVVIGVDAEWRLPACNGGIERLALLQLAMKDAVYLLDMINLPKVVMETTLRHFIECVFGSKQSLKLGYGISSDLTMLTKSWNFAADIFSSPERVTDLRTLEKMIEALLHPTPPPHPLVVAFAQQSTTSTPPTSSKVRRSQSIPSGPTGLSLLVEKCFGRPLDKTHQLSDWERRPLRKEQILYSALDAYCLLEVYEHLKEQGLAVNAQLDVEPMLAPQKQRKTVT